VPRRTVSADDDEVSFPSDGNPELIAIGVVLGLVVASRWIFRPSRSSRAQRNDASDAANLGLLTVIATLPRREAAASRGRLREAGIRASTSLRRDGQFDVLVFLADADRARELLTG
jgi:hypothetical protein